MANNVFNTKYALYSTLIVIIISAVNLMLFQNCSNVNLGKETPISSMKSTVSGSFCSMVPSSSQAYVVTAFGVTNLTAIMKRGKLLTDSDMDGIADVDEIALGYDSQNPRSMTMGLNKTYSAQNPHLLDGFCRQNTQLCMAIYQNSTLTACGTPNALGLTICELQAWSLTNGIDSDFDDIPDYVEFLKGSNPAQFDSQNDMDGDGLTNAAEIAQGTDPNYWDAGTPDALKLKYTHELLNQPIENCPSNQQSWSFKIDQIPMVSTLATNLTDPISQQMSFLNHKENENVIFIYYIIHPLNNPQAKSKLFGQFIKLVPNQSLNLGTFSELGEF